MRAEELRQAIRDVLKRHPNVAVSRAGHVTHAERYLTQSGKPIGFEPNRVKFQNLWVRADSVRLSEVGRIEHVIYPVARFAESKPNHNLFGEVAFTGADLIRFKVSTLGEAETIVNEVTRTAI